MTTAVSAATRTTLERMGAFFAPEPHFQANTGELKRSLESMHQVAIQIRAKAEAEGRDMTPEEIENIEGALSEFDRLAETLEGRGGRPNNLRARPTKPTQPTNQFPGVFNMATGGRSLPRVYGTLGRHVPWAQLHDMGTLDNGGFESLGAFFKAVVAGDPRLKNAVMTEGVGGDGGFAVPAYWLADIMDTALEQEVVRPRAMVLPMQGPSIDIPVSDSFDHSSNIGGFTGRWMGEAKTNTGQNAKLIPMKMTASKLAIFADASNELMEDAPNFERFLADKLVQAVAWYMDAATLTGNGVGKPLGVLNAPSLITVNKESTQTAATIVANNLLKMYAKLHPACHRNAVWVANPTTLPQIASVFTLPINKIGSDVVPVAGGQMFSEPQPGVFSLMGKPLLLSEKLPALGTTGDIILADFSKYIIGARRFVTIEKNEYASWYEDLISWRCTLRVDGRPAWPSVVTQKNGGTQSWAVALETRS